MPRIEGYCPPFGWYAARSLRIEFYGSSALWRRTTNASSRPWLTSAGGSSARWLGTPVNVERASRLAVSLRCRFFGCFVEIGSKAPVAATLITKGAQLLVIQNHESTSPDLTPTGGADFTE